MSQKTVHKNDEFVLLKKIQQTPEDMKFKLKPILKGSYKEVQVEGGIGAGMSAKTLFVGTWKKCPKMQRHYL